MRKRLCLFLVLYALFMFFLFSSFGGSIGRTLFSMAFVYGIAFVLMISTCVILSIASHLAGSLFRVLGYDEYAESTVKSVGDAVGLVPALALIIMVAIPAWILYRIL